MCISWGVCADMESATAAIVGSDLFASAEDLQCLTGLEY